MQLEAGISLTDWRLVLLLDAGEEVDSGRSGLLSVNCHLTVKWGNE